VRNSSLIFRFSGLFLVVVGLLGLAYYMLLREVYYAELHRQAASTADNVEAFGNWVAQYGRIWVKDKPNTSYLSRVQYGARQPTAEVDGAMQTQTADAATGTPAAVTPDSVEYFSKNPALVQRELSEVVGRSFSRAKFHMTSDNWMAEQNRPDDFEAQAIQAIKSDQLDEYIAVIDGQYRYARKIVHTEACIKCHGAPEAAPREVIDRYGKERGFGFAVGDVAGVISVTLPMEPLWESSLRVLDAKVVGVVAAAFVILYLFVYFRIVRPITRLTTAAHNISIGQQVALDVRGFRPKTRNELGKLTLAIARLKTSIELSVEQMRKMQRALKEKRKENDEG
jgi:HAMP domain-containing protein